MVRVALATLGCKVNQVESEAIKEELGRSGYQLVKFSQEADVYIINTCTVTHISDRKSRALIRRARRNNPQARVIAVGCLARVDGPQLAQTDVDLFLGNKEQVVDWLNQGCPNPQSQPGPDCGAQLKPVMYTRKHERTRAFIKIQDGCDAFCSYCIVPLARGPLRSKAAADVVKEMQNLVALGYQEMVLTGIHTGLYGKDFKEMDLTALLKRVLAEVEGEYRIRISSLEPLEVGPRLVSLIRDNPRVCRHLHIPLQSGSDHILSLMNRGYRRDYYRNLVMDLNRQIPGLAITSDVMVGFPDESEADFLQTLDLLQELPMSGLHVFKYSPRPGTPAADYTGQVDERRKQQRSSTLIELAREKEARFTASQIGQKLPVLVEQPGLPGKYWGLSDNYLKLEFAGPPGMQGQLTEVVLTGPGQGELAPYPPGTGASNN